MDISFDQVIFLVEKGGIAAFAVLVYLELRGVRASLKKMGADMTQYIFEQGKKK